MPDPHCYRLTHSVVLLPVQTLILLAHINSPVMCFKDVHLTRIDSTCYSAFGHVLKGIQNCIINLNLSFQ